MAVQLPNLMSSHTPISEAELLETRKPPPELCGNSRVRDHVNIGQKLKILDFSSAATTSGWGFYFLLNEAEKLEQALVQYAKSVAQSYDYLPCSPPSLVYTDLGSACGFRPRDLHGEQQVYDIRQDVEAIKSKKPGLSLAGTAEIPFAAMQTNSKMQSTDLPRRLVGSSRCYRAEAGARGKEARGLYRVHEFTKVEMFAWTLPGRETDVFNEMINIQREIISNLGLPFRRLEMPASDLGASAFRKQDIEVWFPSRGRLHETQVKGKNTQMREKDESESAGGGWGEVTSTSICTDYQTRRLNTLVELPPGSKHKTQYPSTVNGTAMAVPRILAALLECGWNAEDEAVHLPACLWPYMNGQNMIRKPKSETKKPIAKSRSS
ncbi:MAG: Serine--tRNA ligase, mitochondrial [Ramalina farinacea]|uniref:serine--tRNA ligase n=1 Tax=Ramalina farinacea TaxID=258253 RepID=A0AA43TQF1_9LECA|nr:Serine--tRNA ligase, mitochondrial [Ramalina farinacea]